MRRPPFLLSNELSIPLNKWRSAYPTWALAADARTELLVGPQRELYDGTPLVSVSLIPHAVVPAGAAQSRAQVRENAQSFDVVYHRFAGFSGLWHERGRNWIVWSDDLRHFCVSCDDPDAPRSWVYARFILRHCIAARWLAREGYRRSHAVVGPLADGSGLMIAGPYLAGKTFLLEQLIARGVVRELLEDDCAIIDARWQLHALIPQPLTVCRTRRLDIGVLICLDRDAQQIERIATSAGAAWALGLSASWPLSWLPGGTSMRTDVAQLPADLICLRAPERPSADAVCRALETLRR